jgi:hypothetical protein
LKLSARRYWPMKPGYPPVDEAVEWPPKITFGFRTRVSPNEHMTFNHGVEGSSPSALTIMHTPIESVRLFVRIGQPTFKVSHFFVLHLGIHLPELRDTGARRRLRSAAST